MNLPLSSTAPPTSPVHTTTAIEAMELQARGETLSAVIDALPLDNAKKIIEVGCASGALLRAIATAPQFAGEAWGLDISQESVDFAASRASAEGIQNVHFLREDVLRMEAAGLAGTFDCVICRYFLMYFVPRGLAERCLAAMASLARPGGKLVCIEADVNFGADRYPPAPSPLCEILSEIAPFYREQGMIEWRSGARLHSLMRSAGFDRVEIDVIDGRIIRGGLPEELAAHANLTVQELLAPVLEARGRLDLLELAASQWREYVLDPENLLYTPVFAATVTL